MQFAENWCKCLIHWKPDVSYDEKNDMRSFARYGTICTI